MRYIQPKYNRIINTGYTAEGDKCTANVEEDDRYVVSASRRDSTGFNIKITFVNNISLNNKIQLPNILLNLKIRDTYIFRPHYPKMSYFHLSLKYIFITEPKLNFVVICDLSRFSRPKLQQVILRVARVQSIPQVLVFQAFFFKIIFFKRSTFVLILRVLQVIWCWSWQRRLQPRIVNRRQPANM